MAELLLALVPLAIAAALQPPQVVALSFLLQTRHGVANGLAYVGGMTAFRLALGALFWALITGVEEAVESEGGRFDFVVGTVLVVLGIVLLVYALRRGLSARDEDDAAAAWLQKLGSVSPAQAALVGVAFLALDPKDWLTKLAAVDLIAAADLSGMASLVAYLIFTLLAQSVLLIPLILVLAAPRKAEKSLGSLNAWLERNARTLDIVVAVLLGALFLYEGLEHLGVFA
jgi:threonine/homoserine/homoserine lactone efflux protein